MGRQELQTSFKVEPGVDGKDGRSPTAPVPFEYTGRKGESAAPASMQGLVRCFIDIGPGMRQSQLAEEIYLPCFAPVQVSWPQSGKMVWGQIGNLTISDRGKVFGHEYSGGLAQQVFGAAIQGSQGGQVDIQPDLVVKGDEVHTLCFVFSFAAR